MPPKPVNCGVFGKFRKLKTELPPSVWPPAMEEIKRTGMMIHDRTGHEYEKSFGKERGIYVINSGNSAPKKSKLLHEHRGVPFNP